MIFFLKDIPEGADLMPASLFEDYTKAGAFIPDDGIGYWATETQMDHEVDVWNWKKPEWATHVAWFNK